MHKTVTTEDHRSMTSYFNVMNIFCHRAPKKCNVYSYKHTQVVNNPYNHKWENRNSYELKKCGGISRGEVCLAKFQ